MHDIPVEDVSGELLDLIDRGCDVDTAGIMFAAQPESVTEPPP
eukprot:SAG11_NODE_9704_length_888_cov_0.665399_1_plen_42_part_01